MNHIGTVQAEINHYRHLMDECWIELETANTWEHIHEISKRLSAAGLRYKEAKRLREDILSPSRQPRGSISITT
jgi:hypothetical protein